VGAVLSLLALPWLLGTLMTAHESWQRVGQASVATVVVTAATPSLWPVVVVAVLVIALSRSLSHPIRMVSGVIPVVLGPAIFLSLPRFLGWWDQVGGRWWDNWGALFADPGHAASFSQAPWWSALLGWPEPLSDSVSDIVGVSSGTLAIAVFAMGTLLIVLALLSLALGQAKASLVFGILTAIGLVSATVGPSLFSGFQGADAVFVWPGTAVGVIVLGLMAGAGAVLDRVDFHDSLGNALHGFGPSAARIAGAALVVTGFVAPGLIAVQAWSGNISVQPVPAPRTLPAFVAAEAAQFPQVGTLVITATDDAYLVTLERGAGASLMESSTLLRGRDTTLLERDEDLARLSAILVRPSAADPAPLFDKYGISFVLLRDSAYSEAGLTLAQRPELVSASSVESGQLWQVEDRVPAIVAPEPEKVGLAGQWFLGLLTVATILAVPTERRSRGTSRPIDDAVPTLGEETSDDL